MPPCSVDFHHLSEKQPCALTQVYNSEGNDKQACLAVHNTPHNDSDESNGKPSRSAELSTGQENKLMVPQDEGC